MIKTVYAKVVDTFLGDGIEIRGEEDVLISSCQGKDLSKKEYERTHPNYFVIWEN